ncbi:OLC1v1009191C1 [Oldenlandia corymbosa var. corymbosa]|uniref:OLC1v1009191C1 n=1 Tax=Oldenlandia corymbosa var. corymbosa TaxID=529605 RepID=A0AAV1DRN1_OLDCO|nr:OLC1v1009191C1 [Oldenlandia corymbosa var. corymbosa]
MAVSNFSSENASSSTSSSSSSSEIVFFDLETTVPNKVGQRFWVLEFGAIVVCPRKLVELESYCTLIRPKDLHVVAVRSGRADGITREAVADAPSFEDVADKIFSILDGRIWAGHNIQRFDCIRIKEAFAEIVRPAPKPVGIIDSLGVLTEKFGRRAGNMKMATLASYFGLGQQKHRSLDDVRMNLEVLKHCATVLFLESSLPSILDGKWHTNPNVTTRSRSILESSFPSSLNERRYGSSMTLRSSRGKNPCGEETSRKSPPTSLTYRRAVPYATEGIGKMTARVKNLLCKAQNKPLNHILRHSQSLLRAGFVLRKADETDKWCMASDYSIQNLVEAQMN